MNLNDLLSHDGIDPRDVIVMRHRPKEPKLNRVLPWLVVERPELFNAYQQTQGEKVEKAMLGAKYVASFIRHDAGRALFVGLYQIGETSPLTFEGFFKVPALAELKKYGMIGMTKEGRPTCLWFDLRLTDFCSPWIGKLLVGWPPPERSWWRRSHRNDIPIQAIFEDNALVASMPQWDQLILSLDDIAVVPTRWRYTLSQWRGIYFIHDQSDGKGYVGSAYGRDNLLGRWTSYATTGHGGNRLLRDRDPKNFQFSILQRVSPDMDADDVIRVEASWKERLHTRAPNGLNDN